MVLEADRNGCVREVMVIAAALSIQDPRERPADKQQQADEQHARFDATRPPTSWPSSTCGGTSGSSRRSCPPSAFRRMCRSEFLNYLRIREWQDIYSQLRTVAKSIGHRHRRAAPSGATPDRIHPSLLAGLLSHIGLKDAGSEAASTSARAAPSSRSSPARRCSRSRRAG